MKKTILIVDDEEVTLTLTSGILSAQYDVYRALSAHEAIEMYDRFRPQMILSDLLMPEMNGFEMVKILQEKYGRRMPVIFMTASEDEEAEYEGLGLGAVDFIRKPLKADVLLKSVNKIMEHLS